MCKSLKQNNNYNKNINSKLTGLSLEDIKRPDISLTPESSYSDNIKIALNLTNLIWSKKLFFFYTIKGIIYIYFMNFITGSLNLMMI